MNQRKSYQGEDFTFVVCAYKECEYLEECILSLERQTIKAKIIISTSTPNDYIYSIASAHHIEVRVNSDGGQIKDYNFALKQADTKLVMLMHQDEVLAERFVETVLNRINLSKHPIIIFTNYLEMHQDKVDKKPSSLVRIKRIMLLPARITGLSGTWFGKRFIQLLGNPITHPTVVCVKKEMPEEVFREAYHASMDWDLWERLSRQKGEFLYIPDVLLYHRMNDENQTSKLLKTTNFRYEEELEILTRFWPKPIAKCIMHFYSKAAKYY